MAFHASHSESRMLSKSKVSKGYQTVVPSAVRDSYRVEPGDYLEWIPGEEGVTVRFRKRQRLRDLAGIGSHPSDAVAVKKRVQRGGK